MNNKKLYDQVISLTQELVRVKSLSGAEKDAAEAAHRWMSNLGYDNIQVDQCGNVIGCIKGQKSGPGYNILLDGHLDTVPPVEPDRWKVDPLSGEIIGDRLYGIGSVDMKGPLAAMIVAAAAVPKDNFSGKLFISASIGEEAAEGLALKSVIKITQPDFVVVGEPTDFLLAIGQRGRTSIVIETKGVAAHSSNPALGINAIHKMVQVITKIQKMELPVDTVLGQGLMELIEILSSPYPSASVIPSTCRVRYDRRLVLNETQESVLEDLHRYLSDSDGLEISIPQFHLEAYTGNKFSEADFRPAWFYEEGNPWVEICKRALAQAGLDTRPTVVPYCTNGSYSAGKARIPTVIIGPPSIRRAHAIDEFIYLTDLQKSVEVYSALASHLLSATPDRNFTKASPGPPG
jgi:putative selenium metabolism hydrolase